MGVDTNTEVLTRGAGMTHDRQRGALTRVGGDGGGRWQRKACDTHCD